MHRFRLPLALVLSLGLAAACAPISRSPTTVTAGPAVPAVETLTLSAPDGRSVPVLVVAPARPVGVVLFSHGGGTSLAAIRPVIDRLAGEGFAVIAPTHADSIDRPSDQRSTLQAAFATRIGDMATVSGFASSRFAGLPQAALGHSYGALTGLLAGGAFTPMVPGRVEAVKAVVMFSSPGPIPGLSQAPHPLDGVKVPTLLITGTADTVPGFVADPAAHLFYFDRLLPGDHTALVVKGAAHNFMIGADTGSERSWLLVVDFLKARLTGDSRAAARFAAAHSDDQTDVRRR
ncbi:MAG: alpha/beta hydrolase [Novosphingobium sp.]|uniref:alpha/beta hydrolase family protein n=1 Tax=Novosphingobium sp. TaxID=1874826 RepID=UPI0032B71F56